MCICGVNLFCVFILCKYVLRYTVYLYNMHTCKHMCIQFIIVSIRQCLWIGLTTIICIVAVSSVQSFIVYNLCLHTLLIWSACMHCLYLEPLSCAHTCVSLFIGYIYCLQYSGYIQCLYLVFVHSVYTKCCTQFPDMY